MRTQFGAAGTLRRLVFVALAALLAGASAATAATLTKLHDFDDTAGALNGPSGALVQGRDGNLYGTTRLGGVTGAGTAFKLTPGGAFTKLHDFDYGTDGGFPFGGLALGSDGNFYGTTYEGGAGSLGTLFRMTPAGTVTVLHAFSGAKGDGCRPQVRPVEGSHGQWFGTTSVCGKYGAGMVYRLAGGRFSVLFDFPYDSIRDIYPMGAGPSELTILGPDGTLYGKASGGLLGGYSGTVFKVTAQGVGSAIYNFEFAPAGLVIGPDGNFYGVMSGVGSAESSVFFKLTPKGAMTVLKEFDHPTGAAPNSLVLASDGNFYGAADSGGPHDAGLLFRLTPAGAYTVQGEFDGANGARPSRPVQHTNGRIYGLTESGGSFGFGTAYRLRMGAPGFITAVPNKARPGNRVGLLGDLAGTTAVSFNGVPASFQRRGRTYREATVPAGAATGLIQVINSGGVQSTLKPFLQQPVVRRVSPASGSVGDTIVLSGVGLTQTRRVRFAGGKLGSFVVGSDRRLTVTVPAGAQTGNILVTTAGGVSEQPFTVTP